MRSVKVTAIAFVAAAGLVLTGCGGSEEPAASDDNTTAEATPTDSETPTDEETTDDTIEQGDVSDFPDVDGYTLVALPGAAKKAFGAATNSTPQIQKFEGRLVEKGGEQAGLILRIAIDPEAASADGFEEGFLPGFAGGVAGTSAQPDYEDINGVRVVKIATADGTGTAYAWIEDAIATVLVFKDAADAQTFAEESIG